MTALLGSLAVSFLLLVLGAVMAGVEASLLVMPEARLRALRDELGARGHVLDRYLSDPSGTLSPLLAGRVLAPIASMALATATLVQGQVPRWWEIPALVLAVAAVYGTLAEISVTVGRRRARSIAPVALYWIRPLAIVLSPLAAPLAVAGRWASARITERTSTEPSPVTEKEVEYVVEQAQSSGAVDPVSSAMLQNVFGLKERIAREIMVPRTEMVALEIRTTVPDALRRMNDEGHSRVPVYHQQIDNVVGVLFAKDLFREATAAMSEPPPPMDTRTDGAVAPPASTTSTTAASTVTPVTTRAVKTLDAIVRKPAFFVSDSQPVLSVLRDMQTRRVHLAVVCDEFGAVVGLVTLEDILEELVGEIHDEHDTEEARFVELAANRWLVSAALPVGDLGDKLGVKFPQDEDYASLGGFLATHAGKVPEVGTVVLWQGLRFVVREGDKRRATKVEIVRDAPRTPSVRAMADQAR